MNQIQEFTKCIPRSFDTERWSQGPMWTLCDTFGFEHSFRCVDIDDAIARVVNGAVRDGCTVKIQRFNAHHFRLIEYSEKQQLETEVDFVAFHPDVYKMEHNRQDVEGFDKVTGRSLIAGVDELVRIERFTYEDKTEVKTLRIGQGYVETTIRMEHR